MPCGLGEPRYLKALVPLSSAGFGSTIVTDGTTLVVVAPQERAGAPVVGDTHDPAVACPARPESFVPPSGMIHVFSRNGTDWVEEPFTLDGAELITGATSGPPDGPPILSQHNFTLMSVALNGDRLAIGLAGDNAPGVLRGSVRLFERTPSGWRATGPPLIEPETETFSIFGYSVALSRDTLVVGAPTALPPAKGASYVYDLSQDPPLLLKQLRPDMLEDNAVFGADVAVSDDWVRT